MRGERVGYFGRRDGEKHLYDPDLVKTMRGKVKWNMNEPLTCLPSTPVTSLSLRSGISRQCVLGLSGGWHTHMYNGSCEENTRKGFSNDLSCISALK